LSYTDFSYANLRVKGSYPEITVSVDVTNTGMMKGKEVVQLYVGRKESCVERAAKELRGFEKLELEPGETGTAEFALPVSAFSYFDEEKGEFVTEPGDYQIFIGKSVADICLAGKCRIIS